MVNVERTPIFERKFKKIKNNSQKEQLKKLINKIIQNPEIGKPMRYGRKGTREIYMKPFRLSYSYVNHENKIYLLDLYHKDEQ
jgi:mRNA-degrading endonuclease RelE of RelBE toxin-antitoxin system